MRETVSQYIEVFSLDNIVEAEAAAQAVMEGKITLLRAGAVFSFVLNPNIPGLTEKFNVLKERQEWQTMSVVCTYEQALQIVDKKRINRDFFCLTPSICSKVIVRIPVDASRTLPFSYNSKEGTLQFLSFEQAHPFLNDLRRKLANRGCEYLSITSGNLHGAPTIEDVESAKRLAALFNMKVSFLGMHDMQTVVTDAPAEKSAHRGSYAILSFCNPEAIEVKRLANKSDKEFTERYLKELLGEVHTQTPLEFVL